MAVGLFFYFYGSTEAAAHLANAQAAGGKECFGMVLLSIFCYKSMRFIKINKMNTVLQTSKGNAEREKN